MFHTLNGIHTFSGMSGVKDVPLYIVERHRYGVASICRLLKYRSLVQKSPIKQTIFFKRDSLR